MYCLFEFSVSNVVLSNLWKTVRKDGIPTGCDNLRKLVLFQRVKLENVTIKNIYICFLTSELLLKSTAQLREPQFGQRVFVRFGLALLENLLNYGLGIPFQVVNEALSREAAISPQILRLKSVD